MKKVTHENFIKKLYEKRNDVICEGIYVGCETKIKFKCKKCGYEWNATPSNILCGKGCPNCKNKKTHDEFVKEMETINNNVIIIGKYVKDSVKIQCKCKECGYEWKQTPNNLLMKGCGCPVCAAKKRNSGNTLTHDDFMRKTIGKISPSVEIIGKYEKSNKKILCKCKKCGYEWNQLPGNILHGNSCPSCTSSKLEDLVKYVLDENGIKYIEKASSDIFPWIGKQHLDFYLPDNSLAIECQGEQHFKPVKHFGGYNNFIDTIIRDKRKNDLCRSNGIKILYVIQKKYNKYTNKNVILKEIYNDSDKILSDEINNLYCYWKD